MVGVTQASFAGTGFPPFTPVQSGGFDAVNLQSLNVGFVIPVVSHPGRGLGFNFGLAHNSLVWQPVSGKWSFGDSWTNEGPVGKVSNQKLVIPIGSCQVTEYVSWIFTDPGGTDHAFPVARYFGCGAPANVLTGYALDASGYFMDISGSTGGASSGVIVRAPDGTKIDFTTTNTVDANGNLITQNPTITDPNGNQITSKSCAPGNGPNPCVAETDWTDTLGQIALKITYQTDSGGRITETDYNRLAVDGTYRTIAMKYQFVTVQSNFGCSGITEYSGSNVRLVSEIDLPNGQNYAFTYEPTPGVAGAVTGRIQQVTLPTGGTITYQYAGANGGLNCSDGTALQLQRIVSNGTTSATWSYSRSPNNKGGATTITAPQLPYDSAANQTVITFDPTSGFETNRKIYQGSASGTPLRTINTAWTNNSSGSNNTPVSQTVILEDGSTQSQGETTFDTNGLLQVEKEHDWGSGAPGTVSRTTNLYYLNSSAYTSLNIINRVVTQTTADSSGAIKSRTDITYDDSGFVNSKCVTGAAQHDDTNFGCSYTTRGLPTSVTTYTDAATPAGGVTKNFSYDSVGNLVSAQLNCCQQKQWNFSAATQYAFPDSVVSGPTGGAQLTTSAAYYLTTGQIQTATDENGQVTTYTYADSGHLDRLTDIQRPDNAHITRAYNDSQLTVTDVTPIQGSNVIQKVTALDGLGRPVTSTVEDASNIVYSVVQTQYDPLGRPYKSSNPYIGSPQFWATNQFDTLGRPTVVTLQDGAQITSSYNGNSVTGTDPAGKQRKSMSDGLGRLIEVDEPGGGSAGTAASGGLTINGTLQTRSATSGTPSTGSVTISGNEHSKQVQTQPGTSGSGSFTITGSERSTIKVICTRTCTSQTIYDTGTVSVTVNGFTASVNYFSASTTSNLASALAGALNGNGGVSASASGSTVTMTALAVGASTNYSWSSTSATTIPSSFSGTSFPVSPSSGTLSGGQDPVFSTVYDSGTCSVTVNGTAYSRSFGQGDTTSTIASGLASTIGSGSLVSATASGATISLTARAVGASTNYTLGSSCTYDTADFSSPSFGASPSGSALTGGTDGSPAVSDAGTVQMSVGGYSATANYGNGTGQDSTAAAVAADLVGQIKAQLSSSNPPFTIASSGAGISINWGSLGTAGNVTVTTTSATTQTSNFSTPSFASCPVTTNPQNCRTALSGGADPNPPSLSTPATTLYSYGVLDNLLQVTQGVQPRTYAYDGMGRLTDVTTPEAGHVNYQYNSFDLVTQQTDARGVITSYGYDGLNRLQTVGYNVGSTGIPATAGVTYQYGNDSTKNNNGRLLKVLDGLGSETYSYDLLGRAAQLQKVINGTTYTIGYSYNLASELTQITYPSGRVVQQSFDAIGRLCEIAPQTSACATATAPYATAYGYNPASQMMGFNYGNGVSAVFGYSADRLQMTSLNYAKGTQTLFGLNYFYHQDATNCPNGTIGNNGQIQCIVDAVDSGRNVAYSYDTLARLTTAATKGSTAYPAWGLSFSFDRYGNRTAQTVTAGSGFSVSTPVDPTTNHINIAPYSYDANGNMTNDGNNWQTYDAANHLVSSTQSGVTSTYTYDCKSLRALKSSAGTTTVYIFSGSKVIAEYENGAASNAPTREYIYSGSGLLAKIEGATTNYYLADHLSTRMTTDASGTGIGQQGHYPFGDPWYDSGATSKKKLADYERDPESGNDYALARSYVNRIARFASPDPLDGDSLVPQTLNLYSYAVNDPINFSDPSGMFVVGIDRFLSGWGLGTNGFFGANWSEFDVMAIPIYGQVAVSSTQSTGVRSSIGGGDFGPYTNRDYQDAHLEWQQIGTAWWINFRGGASGPATQRRNCITKVMLVTAYSDRGQGSDTRFPYHRSGHGPRSVGPGTVAVAQSTKRFPEQPYPFGASVTVSGPLKDPVFDPHPVDPFNTPAYVGQVHDTGLGFDEKHHHVQPDDWIDIWLPTRRQANKWGVQWRRVTICW
jgi:RHS repeat-associated protein